MGKKHRNKRKKSDASENNDSQYKAGRYTSTPEQVCVSSLIKDANSVLFNSEDADDLANSDFDKSNVSTEILNSQMSTTDGNEVTPPTQVNKCSNNEDPDTRLAPSNADLMKYLKKIDDRLLNMEKRLGKLEILEKKVDNFEREMSRLWTQIQEQNKKSNERLSVVEDRVESADFNLGLTNEKVISLEKENNSLKEDFIYLQSQSMRNNLIFANIEEAPSGVQENTEEKLRSFLEEKMKIAKEQVNRIAFERVHRMGPIMQGNTRKIVAKFTLFKDREMVRKQWKTLDNTPFYVHEQFPKEVVARRRQLIPKLKDAKKNGANAWISYDTLYINGKAQRNDK